jgi:hypothetical protein
MGLARPQPPFPAFGQRSLSPTEAIRVPRRLTVSNGCTPQSDEHPLRDRATGSIAVKPDVWESTAAFRTTFSHGLASKHRIGVERAVWDGLNDIPVLDDLVVLKPEDVDDGVAVLSKEARPMAMKQDEIAVREHAFDFSSCLF